MRKLLRLFGFIAAISTVATVATAQETPEPAADSAGNVLVIYDSSNSMWGELADSSRKYEVARGALTSFMMDGFADRPVGLRAYGHRRKDDCRDSELVRSFEPDGADDTSISALVESIRPTGMTPITYSLTEGLKDLGGESGDILLISDGIETCDADPCELMEQWKATGVNVRVHVVGVGLKDMERTAMACIAETSGGQYFDADSEIAFNDALDSARDAIGTPGPAPEGTSYAIILDTVDSAGNSLRSEGQILTGEDVLRPAVSKGYGRNTVPGEGDYTVEAGALLQDGTIYNPVRAPVLVEAAGETLLTLEVPRPASVSASFIEDGADHSGALIRAYQGDEEVFSFRPGDAAFAREGIYEFRTAPNADNAIAVTETLSAGNHTDIVFDLTQTIEAYVKFQLPNGEIISRQAELWRDGELAYKLHSANGGTIRPGTYELRSPDQDLPLTPVDITLTEDGETRTVPLAAGFLTLTYGGDQVNYVGNADRAFLESVDRGGSSFARPDTAIPVAPGVYRINPYDRAGHFDPIDVTIADGESLTVTIEPNPVGELVINYAPSDAYPVTPDRASVTALEGQRIIGGISTPGEPRKLLPGRYRVTGWRTAGDFPAQEVTINAGERQTVTLQLSSE
ncbi:hypothetical protein [Hyphomonas sp.]|uniref:vWA domain-containing protein n=1 Tax=Hyphomonas sp. TaxID=87 RepID=UPI0035277C4F